MAKIKEASSFDGTSWSAAIPIGADDTNVDITTATTNPGGDAVPGVSDDTSTSLDSAAVTVSSTNNDTDATAWTKFNRFRARVKNALANLSVIAIQDDTPTQGEKLWLDTSGDGYQIPQINDNIVSRTDTWSSHKISAVGIAIQDEEPLEDSKVWIDTDETTSVTIPEMSDLDTKVSKSGDTMTGPLLVQNSNITDGTLPGQNEIFNPDFQLLDSEGFRVGTLAADFLQDGRQGVTLQAKRKVNGSDVKNYIGLFIKSDGTKIVTLDSAAWRSTLGLSFAVNDTEYITNSFILHGIASSNKKLYFDYTVAKGMENISTVTATAFQGILYGPTGVLENGTSTNFVTDTSYTITCLKLNSSRHVRIILEKSSAIPGLTTVGVPIGASCTLTLKFT